MFSIIRLFFLASVLFLLSPNYSNAQSKMDSVKYTIDFKFNDGIFLNFGQVQANDPIPFRNVITKHNYQDNEFVDNIFSDETITIFYKGEKIKVASKRIWGYAQNGVLYIQNRNNLFFRIPSIGAISFFIASVEVEYQTQIDPFSRNYQPFPNQTQTTSELHRFLIDFNDGTLYEYSIKSIANLISSDTELHKEFTDLKKRKQRQMAFIYLRRFNDNNPIYFPKQ